MTTRATLPIENQWIEDILSSLVPRNILISSSTYNILCTLKLSQNDGYLAKGIFKNIFLMKIILCWPKYQWFLPCDKIDNKWALVQAMAWCHQAKSPFLEWCRVMSSTPWYVNIGLSEFITDTWVLITLLNTFITNLVSFSNWRQWPNGHQCT